MKKIILLSFVVGSIAYANNDLDSNSFNTESNTKYNWKADSENDIFIADARNRRGKGQRGRRRGGGGLR